MCVHCAQVVLKIKFNYMNEWMQTFKVRIFLFFLFTNDIHIFCRSLHAPILLHSKCTVDIY